MKKYILFIICLFVLAGTSFAVYQPQITVQGFLTNDSSSALNGSYNLTCKLYNSAIGGTVLFTETFPSVSVSKGVFLVMLNSIERSAGFPAIFRDNANVFLGITVDNGPTGQEISPRTQVPYTAFALLANNSSGESVFVSNESGDDPTIYANGQTYGVYAKGVSVGVAGTASVEIAGIGLNGQAYGANSKGVLGQAQSANADGVYAENTFADSDTLTGSALRIKGKIKISSSANKAVGTGTLLSGQTSVAITNSMATSDCLIFLSLEDADSNAAGGLRVSARSAGSFTVKVMDDSSASSDMFFRYLIIN